MNESQNKMTMALENKWKSWPILFFCFTLLENLNQVVQFPKPHGPHRRPASLVLVSKHSEQGFAFISLGGK